MRKNPDADPRAAKHNLVMRPTICPASFSTVTTPAAIGSETTCPVCGATVTIGYAARITEHDDARSSPGARELDEPRRG